MQFTLNDGRKATLDSFYITNALSVIEFDARSIIDAIRPFMVKHHGETPFHLLGHDNISPPGKYLCVGGFNSLKSVRDDDAWGSFALLVWFVPHNERNLRELIQPCIDACDWTAVAQDYYWE